MGKGKVIKEKKTFYIVGKKYSLSLLLDHVANLCFKIQKQSWPIGYFIILSKVVDLYTTVPELSAQLEA